MRADAISTHYFMPFLPLIKLPLAMNIIQKLDNVIIDL
jgi:hypothetical protein